MTGERLVSKGNVYCSDPSHGGAFYSLVPAGDFFWLSEDGEQVLCGPCYQRGQEDGPVLDSEDFDDLTLSAEDPINE